MEIPIFIILILYLLLTLCFLVFSLFLVYHAVRFGVATAANVLALVFYLAVATMILMGAYSYITTIDWSQTIRVL